MGLEVRKMKRFLKYFLVFLLAIGGGLVGSAAGNKLFQPKTVVSVQPAADTTSTVQNVTYNTTVTSDLKSAIRKAYDTVVEIQVQGTTTDFFYFSSSFTSLGSGVLISSDGYIITNYHVVKEASKVTVKTSDGTEYEARLIGTDSKTDLAVIKIDAQNMPYAELADSDKLEIGDQAIVIGNPLGEGISVSNGIISALDKELVVNRETMYLIQTNAAVNQGNSGGGLFDINGDLIGIVNAKGASSSFSTTTVEGLGYAIPSNTVYKITTDLMANGYVKNRATLGVKLGTVTQQNGAFSPGCYITEVISGSAAEAAGLQQYDKIVRFEDQEVSTYSEVSALLMKYEIGDTVKLGILRNNKEMDVYVTLQEGIGN